MAGIYYWFPKITGRMFDEKLGQLNFWLMFIGFNLAFFPMHFTGLDGMPRRIYTYSGEMGWGLWNAFSTAGAFLLAVSLLLFTHNMVKSWRKGEPAGDDPWDARTLEWSISSPPPEYNFAEIPTVYGRDPWWDQKRRQVRRAVPVGGGSGYGEQHENEPHMPQPSYWPIVASIGLLIGSYGLIYHFAVAGLGGAIAMIAVYAWSFEPASEEPESGGH